MPTDSPQPKSIRFLSRLTLRASCLQTLAEFYGEKLDLPVSISSSRLLITTGRSQIKFVHVDASEHPIYHLAFNIPENQIEAAFDWLAERTAITSGSDGEQIVHFEDWNAHSIYFTDPAGNILEFIARHEMDNACDEAFGSSSILSISEVGLVVEDVSAAATEIERQLGMRPYRPGTSEFCAMGDSDLLLILVKRGRPWFMAQHIHAAPSPIEMGIDGNGVGEWSPANLPYRVRMR